MNNIVYFSKKKIIKILYDAKCGKRIWKVLSIRINSLQNYNVQREKPFIMIQSIYFYKPGSSLFFIFLPFASYVNIYWLRFTNFLELWDNKSENRRLSLGTKALILSRLALNKNSFQGNFHFTVIFVIQCFFLTSNSHSRSNASFGRRPCVYRFFVPMTFHHSVVSLYVVFNFCGVQLIMTTFFPFFACRSCRLVTLFSTSHPFNG